MTTNQIMTRKIGNFDVFQRTNDGYFNATSLVDQWNSVPENKHKTLQHYLELPSVHDLIEEIQVREGDSTISTSLPRKTNFQAIRHSRIKNQGKVGRPKDYVYMHPVLFIDFAMWLNPKFKYDVIKFCYDKMIDYRKEAGDAYKRLSAAIQMLVDEDFKLDMHSCMEKVAEALNYIVFNKHYKEIRNDYGEESKMRELFDLQTHLSSLVEYRFIKTFNELIEHMRAMYVKKYTPTCMR